ncbi:MAG: hypothetical protein LBR22_08855 [Desulfovibrio sp.]|jgi:hypothetical protein|nr:hypothetical protein [Desulfovibrio sp.]
MAFHKARHADRPGMIAEGPRITGDAVRDGMLGGREHFAREHEHPGHAPRAGHGKPHHCREPLMKQKTAHDEPTIENVWPRGMILDDAVKAAVDATSMPAAEAKARLLAAAWRKYKAGDTATVTGCHASALRDAGMITESQCEEYLQKVRSDGIEHTEADPYPFLTVEQRQARWNRFCWGVRDIQVVHRPGEDDS